MKNSNSLFRFALPLISAFSFSFAGLYPEAPISAPKNWGHFQIGLNNNDRTEWDTPMKKALDGGAQLDRRYLYITTQSDVDNVYFSSWKNYAKDTYYTGKGVRPAIVVYFVNNGLDDIDALVTNCANSAHMKAYLETIAKIATQAKGSKPIYVIEPDLWGYMLQRLDEQKIDYLPKSCNLGNLGLSWLNGHGNTIGDLPEAIIKTIRAHDPEAYAGILMAFWSYQGGSVGSQMVDFKQSDVIRVADSAGSFLNRLLETSDKGDFIGVEKNGTDAGWWKTQKGNSGYYWNDTQNKKWLDWSQRVSQKIKLPALGWQICIGTQGLPNTANAYEDTFFEYFFNHGQDFKDAGFIGMLAGCANQGVGTVATIDQTGDKGFFYNKLKTFDRTLTITPNLQSISRTPHSKLLSQGGNYFLYGPQGKAILYLENGAKVSEWNHQTQSQVPVNTLRSGHYILKLSSEPNQSWNIQVQ